MGRVCAIAIPEPCILPYAGIAMGTGIYADIAAKSCIIVVDDGIDCCATRPALLPCMTYYMSDSHHKLSD